MATAAEIQAAIAACDENIAREDAEIEQARQERELAVERQRLRRILERTEAILRRKRLLKENLRTRRARIDSDHVGPHAVAIGVAIEECDYVGPHAAANLSNLPEVRHEPGVISSSSMRHTMDCRKPTLTGELEWSIKGMTWLEDTLAFEMNEAAISPAVLLGSHEFNLCYHPAKGTIGTHGQRASLAIVHERVQGDLQLLSFRYKLFVMSRHQGYVQWGEDGWVCMEESNYDGEYLFGPDVCEDGEIPNGIFGFNSHQQLIESEWVVDDTLTVKLQLTVRDDLPHEPITHCSDAVVNVPPSTFISDCLALLESGSNADVTFDVQGETVQAHSQVLSARSEVLQRQFACGMQESASKKVVIEDCEPRVFKSFLRYLYSDDFLVVEKFLKEDDKDVSSGSTASIVQQPLMPFVQQLLALAHKYQLTRLQLWCESKLIANISVDHVCSILCQANLYMAKNLEKKCLDFIRQNLNEVFATEAYTCMIQKWPQVNLKIIAHLGNLPEATAVEAMEVQQNTGKRKRDE